MAAFSDYFENKILNLYFGAVAYATPAKYWIAAYTTAPNDTGTGTAVEVSGGGYARIEIDNNTSVFGAAGSSSVRTLAAAVAFPEATADWGTITAIALLDAVSGGNLIGYATLTPSQIINSGDVLRIPAGTAGLQITLD